MDLEAASKLIASREKEFDAQKAEFEKSLNEARTRNDNLFAVKAEAEKSLASTLEQLSKAREELESHKSLIANAQAENEKAQNKIAELTANLEKARGDIDAATALIRAREKEFAEAAEKGNKYKATVAARIATLEGELENARGEIGRLKSLLDQAKKDQAIVAEFVSKNLRPLRNKLMAQLASVSGWNDTFNDLLGKFSTFFMLSLNREAIDAFCSAVDGKEQILKAINSDRRHYDAILRGGEIGRVSREAIALINSIWLRLNALRKLNQSGSYKTLSMTLKRFC